MCTFWECGFPVRFLEDRSAGVLNASQSIEHWDTKAIKEQVPEEVGVP